MNFFKFNQRKFENTVNLLEEFIPLDEIREFEELNIGNLKKSDIACSSSRKIVRVHHHHKNEEGFFQFFKSVFRTKKVRAHFILSIFLWSVNHILYYSVITNLDRIENYINYSFEVYFFTQMFSNLFLAFVVKLVIPKNIIYTAAICNLINIFFGFMYSENTLVLVFIFFVFTFLSGMINQSIYLFIPELFEAKIRSTCVSYTKFPAKIILMITPFIWGTNMAYLVIGFFIFIFLVPFLMFFLHSEEKIIEEENKNN